MTDAAWEGDVSGEYNLGGNWTGNQVPAGTATFGAVGETSIMIVSGGNPIQVGGWTFEIGAQDYGFTLALDSEFNFLGPGIDIQGG